MKKSFHSLFTFSKKERRAILFLIALIFLARSLPFIVEKIWPPVFPEIRAEKIEELITAEKNLSGLKNFSGNSSRKNNDHSHVELHPFPFDPNSLDEKGWLRLGVEPSAAQSILKYLSKGGRFRQPDDLYKMYRLDSATARQLIPFVRISDVVPIKQSDHQIRSVQLIEINTADSMQWMLLPGIGPVLSGRIVSFRKKLGGFVSTMQLKEVYGMKDSVLTNILPCLKVDSSGVQRIHLNAADLKTLAAHPYIKYAAAKAIITYREAHGPFLSVQDVGRILSLPPGLLEKALPYLTL